MKTLRTVSLCMFMAFILLVVPSLFAQEETFGLSDADFELFTAANAATTEVDSFAFDFTASYSLTGAGEDGDGIANLTGSGVLGGGDNPVFELAVTGEVKEAGETTPLDLQVRLVDGVLYWVDNTNDEGWQGQTMEDLTSQLGSLAGGMTGTGVNPEDLASGDLSGLSGMEGVSEAMTALSQLEPSEFISMSRTDSEGLAQFTIDFSISDLLSSPSLAPLFMMGISGGAGVEGMEIDEEQMAAMASMFAAMFSEATVTFDEYVDPATSLVQRAVLDINLPLPDMTGSGQTTTIALNFDVNLSGFNEPVAVEAPADAVMQESGG